MAGPFYWAWVDQTETTFTTDHVREDEVDLQLSGRAGRRRVRQRSRWRSGIPASACWLPPARFGAGCPGTMAARSCRCSSAGWWPFPTTSIKRWSRWNSRRGRRITTRSEAQPWPTPCASRRSMIRCSSPKTSATIRTWCWRRVPRSGTSIASRMTCPVTDVLVGEDGNEEFQDSEVPYDSVPVPLNQPPLRSVSVDGDGQLDAMPDGRIRRQAQCPLPDPYGRRTDRGWPKTGSSIDGGWKVVDGRAADAAGIASIPDELFNRRRRSFDVLPFPDTWVALRTLTWQFGTSRKEEAVLVPLWEVIGTLRVGYDVKRTYTRARPLHAASQCPADRHAAGRGRGSAAQVNGADVGEAIDGANPDRRRSPPAVFHDRPRPQSVEYLIALARAHCWSARVRSGRVPVPL